MAGLRLRSTPVPPGPGPDQTAADPGIAPGLFISPGGQHLWLPDFAAAPVTPPPPPGSAGKGCFMAYLT